MRREPTKQDRKRAIERTRKWREKRAEKRAPEARQVDRAVVAALLHIIQADTSRGADRMLPPTLIRSLMETATLILEHGHDRADARAAIGDRLRALNRIPEVRTARNRRDAPEEARRMLGAAERPA